MGKSDVEASVDGRFYRRLPRRRRDKTSTRYGVGSTIFVLSMPLSVVGVIFTIVAYSTINPTVSISSFAYIGPICLCLSGICFISGAILADIFDVYYCTYLFGFRLEDGSLKCPCYYSGTGIQKLSEIEMKQTYPTKTGTSESEKRGDNEEAIEAAEGSNTGSNANSSTSLRQCKVHPY